MNVHNKLPISFRNTKFGAEENRMAATLIAIWGKIQDLKKYEHREKVDASTSPEPYVHELSDNEDASYNVIRCKLLRLQLEYCRYLVLKKYPLKYKNTGTNTDDTSRVNYNLPRSQVLDDELDEIPVKLQASDNLSQKHFCENCNCVVPDKLLETKKERDHQQSITKLKIKETNSLTRKREMEKPTKQVVPRICSKNQSKNLPISKHQHSHLKLNEVPFLIGTVRNNCSTNPSHSVIASVQTIINSLKNHNVRCSFNPAKVTETSECQKKLNVLKDMGKDFDELSVKHQELEVLSKTHPDRRDIKKQCKDTFEILQEKAKHIVYYNAQMQSDKTKLRSQNLPRWKSAGNIRICN